MPSKIQISGNDYGEYAPRACRGLWAFQESYIDAFAQPHVLPSQLWNLLRGYYELNGSELHKLYTTRSSAFRSLEKAQLKLARKEKLQKIYEVFIS